MKYAGNPGLWEQILAEYGNDGNGHVPKEVRTQAVAEYKKRGGKLVRPKDPELRKPQPNVS